MLKESNKEKKTGRYKSRAFSVVVFFFVVVIFFSYVGCPPRDNDESEKYGGIAYLYNDEYVEVSSSASGTEDTRANCVYTGKLNTSEKITVLV